MTISFANYIISFISVLFLLVAFSPGYRYYLPVFFFMPTNFLQMFLNEYYEFCIAMD